jgi:hypothetical protein
VSLLRARRSDDPIAAATCPPQRATRILFQKSDEKFFEKVATVGQ